MSDNLEQSLLMQFATAFMVGRQDCSNISAEFRPDIQAPTMLQENGTIYGQVFRSNFYSQEHPTAEPHFYHLWLATAGPIGNHLDTEHVAVLVRASDSHLASAKRKALFGTQRHMKIPFAT
jgi:hypothetical protein